MTHTSEMPYISSQCNKSFLIKKITEYPHDGTHWGNPYKGTQCNEIFSKDYDLNKHVRDSKRKKSQMLALLSNVA